MKTLELFSGLGGLAKGLELAGCEPIGLVEINKQACHSLRSNFPANQVVSTDVRDLSCATFRNVDLVAGGPPCQPFSLAGMHHSYQDERDMFPYAIKVIREIAPKAFIFENVKGLLRPSFNQYFQYILLRLTYPNYQVHLQETWLTHLNALKQLTTKTYGDLHYNVSYQLLNAADYGVPQSRQRVFIVGVRSDLNKCWRFPEPTHSSDSLLWSQYVSGDYWQGHDIPLPRLEELDVASYKRAQALQKSYGLFPPDSQPWQTVRDALGHLPEPEQLHAIKDHIFRDGAKSYPGHTGSCLDWPAKTLKAGVHGVPGGENMLRRHDGSVRYFTTHEAKLLQTFPVSFVVQGAWSEAMRQIGNAVPVLLAQKLGEQLITSLKQPSDKFNKTDLRAVG